MLRRMTKLNPYAEALGDRDPLEVLRSTPAALRAELAAHPAATDHRPGEKRWSAREVVCHLADAEIVQGWRLRQALAQPHHHIQPFQQDDWAERYAAYELEDALSAFLALRQFTLRLLATLKPADYERPLTHPDRGTMTVQVFVESFAGHDLTHLDQLRRNWRDLAGAGAAG